MNHLNLDLREIRCVYCNSGGNDHLWPYGIEFSKTDYIISIHCNICNKNFINKLNVTRETKKEIIEVEKDVWILHQDKE
ncbi:MAG TPA: hypothetical protein VFX18_00200 [Candidatus Nitrosocosmicus sp.]|nr:hypothetical protein [Candidatus Nitrosocosmicus sp.]